MPTWIPIFIGAIVAAATLATAIGVLWTKVLRPLAKLIATMEKLLPVSRELVKAFQDTPEAFKVLNEIAAQFKTDSGSSLRDVVNRLEAAATESRLATDQLRVGVEANKLVGEMDRARIERFLVKLDRLDVKVTEGAATGLRMEERAAGIAGDLVVAQKAVDGVAEDLALSHDRANKTHPAAPAGTAADAAAQQTKKEREAEDK